MTLPRNIVVGTDFSEQADRAVVYAIELAKRLGAHVHLVHGWTVPIESMGEAALFSGDMLKQIEDDAQQAMEKVLARYRANFADITGLVICGDARDVVLKLAVEKHAELIVVGTHGRHGFSRALLGSVAESIVRTAPCPVLVAR